MGAKMGELRPPAISHPRLSDRCPSADLAIPGLYPVVHKKKGEPAKRGYAIWHGQVEGGGRVVYYVPLGGTHST
jgi:hypothetical protein